MKKLIATTLMAALLFAAPTVNAESVTCRTEAYGGAVCGVETSTEVTVEHKTVAAGVADMQLWQIGLALSMTALVAGALYKLSYRWYILG